MRVRRMIVTGATVAALGAGDSLVAASPALAAVRVGVTCPSEPLRVTPDNSV